MVIIMFFEDLETCPLLEYSYLHRGFNPHCVMIYDDLTIWTIEELCNKNFTKCPVYKKTIDSTKK